MIQHLSKNYNIKKTNLIDKLKHHFLRKENLINWILYLIGFCVACWGYGLKAALLLVLFAISIIVCGFFVVDTFMILRYSKRKLGGEQIVGFGISLLIIIIDIFFLKTEIIIYIMLLSFIISLVGIYYGIKANK